MSSFAHRLKEARNALGLTQEQLGFAVGVTKSSVSAWENGRETPSFTTLLRLRSSLKRSLDELICGEHSAHGVREESALYGGESELAARDERERVLLVRYRELTARKRAALLELIAAAEVPRP